MLREKIIVDLERRFCARLENDKLFECLGEYLILLGLLLYFQKMVEQDDIKKMQLRSVRAFEILKSNKTRHPKRLILTVYDQVFVWLVVTPIFAGTWRGTWGNADSLIDTVLFDGNLVGSAFFCLFAGLALSSILMLRLETIEWFAKSSGR